MALACTALLLSAPALSAQDGATAAPDNPVIEDVSGAPAAKQPSVVYQIIFGAGPLCAALWFSLFGAFGFYLYLLVDSAILVRASKIMPQTLINNVEVAMKEGDVVKALKCCENEPGPMANILSAGFSHVEEGYEVIQEAVGTAADLEVERIMQKLTWFSVNGNISPMLGLLGTVMGMIMAFKSMGAGGTPDVGVLAVIISFSLWTTAAGLCVAIPCVATYYAFRNNATRIVLRMEAITMELLKDLRNVQIVNE